MKWNQMSDIVIVIYIHILYFMFFILEYPCYFFSNKLWLVKMDFD
jgi:hypothetical protein